MHWLTWHELEGTLADAWIEHEPTDTDFAREVARSSASDDHEEGPARRRASCDLRATQRDSRAAGQRGSGAAGQRGSEWILATRIVSSREL
jgi:hypothetical protein